MAIIVSRRRLEPGDFDAWKVRFEQQVPDRRAAGCRGVRRFRGVDDPRELMIIFDWDTHENAWKFINAKMAQNPHLTEQREGGAPKHENLAMEELPPLES